MKPCCDDRVQTMFEERVAASERPTDDGPLVYEGRAFTVRPGVHIQPAALAAIGLAQEKQEPVILLYRDIHLIVTPSSDLQTIEVNYFAAAARQRKPVT